LSASVGRQPESQVSEPLDGDDGAHERSGIGEEVVTAGGLMAL